MQSVQDERPEAEFEELFRTHYRVIERFVAARYSSVDTADVMSVTFSTAWRRFDDLPREATRRWLISIARNSARNSLRSWHRRQVNQDAFHALPHRVSTGLYDHAVPSDTLIRLESAIGKLAPHERLVIELSAFDGLAGSELAAELRVSAGAAAVRLHRARRHLADILKDET